VTFAPSGNAALGFGGRSGHNDVFNRRLQIMARKSSLFPWAGMAFQGAMLAIEAQQVIALRLAKIAAGGAAGKRESELMVAEKVEAMTDAGGLMFKAALVGKHDLDADKVVQLYRRKVRANRRRLSA